MACIRNKRASKDPASRAAQSRTFSLWAERSTAQTTCLMGACGDACSPAGTCARCAPVQIGALGVRRLYDYCCRVAFEHHSVYSKKTQLPRGKLRHILLGAALFLLPGFLNDRRAAL